MGKWMGNWGYSRCKWSYNPVTCLYAHFVELEDWELAEISSEVDLHSRFQVCEGADMSWFDSRKSRCSYVFHFRFLRSCFKFRTIDNHKMGMYTNENQHDNEKATSWLFEDVSPINNYDFSASHHNLLECSLRCFFRCCSVCIFQTPENDWRLELELVYFLSCQGVQWKTAPCFSFSVSVLPVWFDGSSRIWHVFEVDWSRILSGILGRWKPNFRRSKLEEHVWDLYGIYDQQFDVFRSFCLLLVGGSVSFNSTWSKTISTDVLRPFLEHLEHLHWSVALTAWPEVNTKKGESDWRYIWKLLRKHAHKLYFGRNSWLDEESSLRLGYQLRCHDFLWFPHLPGRRYLFCLRLFVGGEVRLPQQ